MRGASDKRTDAGKPRHRSIAMRLLFGTLAAGLAFSLLSTLVRGWSAYVEGRTAFISELGQLREILQPALSKAIWEMDRDSVELNLQGSLRLSAIGRIAVTIRLPGAEPEIHARQRAGWQFEPNLPVVRQELVFSPYAGSKEVLGELEIVANGEELQARMRREIGAIFVAQLLQSLLLAGVVMWLFNRSVTRHVRHIAMHLGQLSPGSLTRKLHLVAKKPPRDELDQLAAGVNELQDRLAAHLERQEGYELEMARHRDRLAELVSERTRELEIANRKLEELSRHDELTSLPNRRHFEECRDVEFRRARRSRQPLALLICDIDYFKRFNDAYGHLAGDECLRAVAAKIAVCFQRAGDVAARVGGEEFAVLLPGATAGEAAERAEHMRRQVMALALPHRSSDVAPVVTLSIGIAELDDAMADFEALYRRADEALYRAKNSGRNRAIRLLGGEACEPGSQSC